MRQHLARIALALAATSGVAFAATPPTLPGPAFPNYRDAAQVKLACDRGLADTRARLRQLERVPGGPRWVAAMDDFNTFVEDVSNPIFVLTTVHPDPAVRTATEACELRWQDFTSTLGQNQTLYRAALKTRPRDAIERQFLKTTIDAFIDAGVSLPAAQCQRAKALNDRITELSQTFEKNIRNQPVRLAFSEAELAGVAPSLWAGMARDAEGRILLTVDDATFAPVMRHATNASTRERFWRADNTQGGEANLKLLAELGQLRREVAQLFGAASFADFKLRRNMARTEAAASQFLQEVGRAVGERERIEVEEIRAEQARTLGLPLADVKLQRWDVSFYAERLRRARFDLDQETFRAYLPVQASLALTMRMTEKLLGVKYTRVEGVALWHPDVQAYAVSDAATGKPLASLFVDLYTRDGKQPGAWAWSFRNSSTRLNRLPQAVLVTNLDRRGLTLEDLGETLLHEFGHSVHNNLSATRLTSQGGTNVLADFVEAPSQMLEDWIYDRRVLDLLPEVCAGCQPVPEALVAKAREAKRFGLGRRYGAQALYASFDLAMHGAQAPDPMALWVRMEGATPLGYVPGTLFPAGFTHIASGYAAGYYGYLWSEVVAADLRTAFGNNRLDPVVGRRYRDTVLANAGQRPPQELLREFLGRDTNAQAFFEELKR